MAKTTTDCEELQSGQHCFTAALNVVPSIADSFLCQHKEDVRMSTHLSEAK